jgi:hypothetical protein
MSFFREILLIAVPLLIFLAAVFVMLRHFFKENIKKFEFLKNEQDLQRLKLSIDKKLSSDKILITHKLQAYERMALFLERINPPNLITRNISPGQKSQELQKVLISSIREEYEHNMSQQIFLASSSWELIKAAKEEITGLINECMSDKLLNENAAVYAQKILGKGFTNEKDTIDKAMQSLKSDLADL